MFKRKDCARIPCDQWLGLDAFTVKDLGLILVGGTKILKL